MDEERFCQRCEQRLPDGKSPLMAFIDRDEKIYQFKDGYYCSKCAKIKVGEKRK